MTNDQLWGAVFIALGVFQAGWIYRLLDSGQWKSVWGTRRNPILIADRRANPFGFWAGVTWEVLAMIIIMSLGAYMVGPSILSVLGK